MTPTDDTVETKPDPAGISDVLRAFLVRCGSSSSRRQLAERLATEGLSVAELERVCVLLTGRGKPLAETAAMIGAALRTEESWREHVADLDYAEDHRGEHIVSALRAATPDSPYPNMPLDLQPFVGGPCAHGVPPTETCEECAER